MAQSELKKKDVQGQPEDKGGVGMFGIVCEGGINHRVTCWE